MYEVDYMVYEHFKNFKFMVIHIGPTQGDRATAKHQRRVAHSFFSGHRLRRYLPRLGHRQAGTRFRSEATISASVFWVDAES